MNCSPLPWGEGGGGGTGCVRKRGIKEPTRRGPPWPRPSFSYTTAITTTLLDGRRVLASYLTQLLHYLLQDNASPSHTCSPFSSKTLCISPSPRMLRFAIPNLERVSTWVFSFDVAIMPTTSSSFFKFIPRTPPVTRPWTLTVNPIEPSGFSFV